MATEALPTRLEDHRRGAHDRIVRAARLVLAERGLAARVEDVAEAASVSRRTVFRYFDTREQLLAAALADSIRSYADHIPRPQAGQSLAAWLDRALLAIHTMNAQHGRIYFELALANDLDGALGEIVELRRSARGELVRRFTSAAWKAANGPGRPPRWLADAVAVMLSAFATEALMRDFGRTPAQVATAMAAALTHAIEGAVAERSSDIPRSSG
jgi:AcrR family transcriptional regulator